jgi:hypothetical protein
MAIPARQIGQPSSTKAQLLWQISKQLENLIRVTYNRGVGISTTTTTTTTVGPFINTIIISNGSLSATNGTYTRPDIATAFSQVGGTGTIFFGGDAWYLNSGIDGNAARNTSELGTGTWEAWAPGNSSGITAEYIYSNTTTTTTTIV